jgi:hypothetical protein
MPHDDMLKLLEDWGAAYDGDTWRMAGRKSNRDRLAQKLIQASPELSRTQALTWLAAQEEKAVLAAPVEGTSSEDALWELHGRVMAAIFEPFRWAVDPNGRVKVFARTRWDCWQCREVVATPTELHRELRDAMMVLYANYPDSLARLRDDMSQVTEGLKLQHGPSLEGWLRAGLNPQLLENPDARMAAPPVPISDDADMPCLLHVDRSLLVPGDHPSWDQVEAKLHPEEAQVLRAYLWSIFDPVNHGRQGLWIKGGRATGKSVLINAIARVMGEACAAVSANSLGNQFWAAKVHRRRLVVYADCKYSRFLTDGKFHSVLGGDQVDVEHKHRSSETHRVHCRVIVGSNQAPEVNLESDDEASRVIMVELDNSRVDTSGYIHEASGTLLGDGDFEEGLVQEFWSYLADCEEDYHKLCPTRQNILLPPFVLARIGAQCGSPEDALFATIAEECLEFDPVASIDATAFRGWLMRQLGPSGRDNHVVGRCYQFLERHHGVRRIRRMEGQHSRITRVEGARIVHDLPQVRTRKKQVGQ